MSESEEQTRVAKRDTSGKSDPAGNRDTAAHPNDAAKIPRTSRDTPPALGNPASSATTSHSAETNDAGESESTRGGTAASQALIERFRQTDTFKRLDSVLQGDESSQKPTWLRGLPGSSRSLLVASLAKALSREVVVVAPDLAAAEDLKEDLSFLLGRGSAAILPDPGLDPYHARHPKLSLRASRIEMLAALSDPARRMALPACADLQVVIVTAVALCVPVPSREAFEHSVHRVRVGEEVDLDFMMELLVADGFQAVPMVSEYGEVSRRGGILDVFSFGRVNPIRIEFDGDEVSSIREFDAYNQRSVAKLEDVVILPLWEWLPGAQQIKQLREDIPEGADPDEWEHLIESLQADGTLEGIEWSLPALGLETASVADYVPDGAMVVVDGPTYVRTRQNAWSADLQQAWEILFGQSGSEGNDPLAGHLGLPPSPPQEIFFLDRAIEEQVPTGKRIYIGSGATTMRLEDDDEAVGLGTGIVKADFRGAASSDPPPPKKKNGRESEIEAIIDETDGTDAGKFSFNAIPPETFGRDLEQTRSYLRRLFERAPDMHIICDTENHKERLIELLKKIPAQFHVGNLANGFVVPDEGLAVLTDHEIFSRSRRRTTPRRYAHGMSIKELLGLNPGDFVVHVEHGIGCFKGMSRLVVDGQETDCLSLEYSGGDVLYIPVDQLMKVQKYSSGDGARPALSKMGGKGWAKTKAKVKKSIKDMAEELIKTYALRKSRDGFKFSADTEFQKQLEASFPYDETPDQMRAIEEVRSDMESTSPMDRLICGDVGYGKTEVAIRAAFKGVMDGKQVALLVPTTLLAAQHYQSFRARLEGFPVKVEYLSRFRSTTDTKDVIERLGRGDVDIVIGTHKLLGKAVKFKDLGVLIIDEEQLFGVKAKEALKKYRETVDVLTLTATPIPRTMHLALMGGRDMSTILTPPRDRRPIQTEVLEFRDDVIAHALMQEADRGGQSFFVHNRVESIDQMAHYISNLVPHLRIAVGHGQMREHALENVMRGFLDFEYDVLVSTMIIESGLDLPNVNTIIINRGDTFGLSQLYQLRGRVGRSARKAYAYLLLPPHRVVSEQAQKRLKAIEEFEDLGSGYQLALRDLEIRGAGDLLGSQQSGFIISVGFELYCQLLDEAVRELKGIESEEFVEPKMSTDIEAFLPEEYVPDSREKINIYKSLADARDLDSVERIAGDLSDRFGRHPESVLHLLGLRRVRILAAKNQVERVVVRQNFIQLEMIHDLKKDEIGGLISRVPYQVELQLHGRHKIVVRNTSGEEAVSAALILLRALEKVRK